MTRKYKGDRDLVELRHWYFNDGDLSGEVQRHPLLNDGTLITIKDNDISYRTNYPDGDMIVGTFAGGTKYILHNKTKRII